MQAETTDSGESDTLYSLALISPPFPCRQTQRFSVTAPDWQDVLNSVTSSPCAAEYPPLTILKLDFWAVWCLLLRVSLSSIRKHGSTYFSLNTHSVPSENTEVLITQQQTSVCMYVCGYAVTQSVARHSLPAGITLFVRTRFREASTKLSCRVLSCWVHKAIKCSRSLHMRGGWLWYEIGN
jgi:hypothetical protein